MTRNPLVSVIVPTWNRAGQVGAAIESILAQTYRPVEIVVVDDGSTDDTPRVVAAYGDRIVAIRQENRGASAARNSGIRASKGELIGFLDSDDEWLPGKVERQVALLDTAGPETVCALANSTEMCEDGGIIRSFEANRFRPSSREGVLENPTDVILSRFLLFNPNVLVRREALFAAGLFDESLRVLEDYKLAVALSFMGPWCYTMEPLAVIHRGAPHSLRVEANRDGRIADRTITGIYERLMRDGRALTARQTRLIHWGINRARRRLERSEGGVSWAGAVVDRLLEAGWRRSPLFPQPRVRAIVTSVVQGA